MCAYAHVHIKALSLHEASYEGSLEALSLSEASDEGCT